MLSSKRTYVRRDVPAIDVMTGQVLCFIVEHDGARVYAIRYPEGFLVSEASEQFTEVEAAFLIDLMAEKSDVDPRHWRSYY